MSSTAPLTLVSHNLCPYVQRAAIALIEKGVDFQRRWVDLSDKPAWFRAVSPLGKTPVLLVGDQPIFESAVICDYLDEVYVPRLHPEDPLARARHRAWIAFASTVLDDIWSYYSARDAAAHHARYAAIQDKFAQVEAALGAGPWFAGDRFSLVDAAFAPVFRYFDAFERIGVTGAFEATPKVRAWRAALAQRPSVAAAAAPDYPARLDAFLRARGSVLSERMAA
ncbi:MAG TPA: glutathione S-transferase family protein [Vineibacter sp.]|nr:glutathione S-transferase family protein [Vineibacter sp.]